MHQLPKKRLGNLSPEAAIESSNDEQNEEQGLNDSFTQDQSFKSPNNYPNNVCKHMESKKDNGRVSMISKNGHTS